MLGMPEGVRVMRKRLWVYLAGPYTKPDPVENTRNALLAADRLYAAGLFPVVPHLSLLSHLVAPHPPEYWYEFDMHLLDRCDALLRLPGESPGADREVDFAMGRVIPVFRSEDDLLAWWKEDDGNHI
jgi:nucleoside 2-deoxyribosyltransferase